MLLDISQDLKYVGNFSVYTFAICSLYLVFTLDVTHYNLYQAWEQDYVEYTTSVALGTTGTHY